MVFNLCTFLDVHKACTTSFFIFLLFFFMSLLSNHFYPGFFPSNYCEIVTTNFGRYCGSLWFAAQPMLLFSLLWASGRMYCHNNRTRISQNRLSLYSHVGCQAIDQRLPMGKFNVASLLVDSSIRLLNNYPWSLRHLISWVWLDPRGLTISKQCQQYMRCCPRSS